MGGTYCGKGGGHHGYGQGGLYRQGFSLLADTGTYRNINKDPIIKLKNKLTQMLWNLKQAGWLIEQNYGKVYPTSAIPQQFYGLPKFTKLAPPSDPLCPVWTPLHMEWQRNWQTSFILWLATTSRTLNILCSTYNSQSWNQVRLWHPMMSRPFSPQFPWTLPSK